jgi:hypothetical protein
MTSVRARLALFGVSVGIVAGVWLVLGQVGGKPVDAWCYWITDPDAPYGREAYQFVYSPPIAAAMSPLLGLPFDAFVALIRGAEMASLVVLAGPLAGFLLIVPPVATELNAANINIVLALMMVLGFRWPVLWVLPLLTKPSMGIGLIWFLVRGEWGKLALAIIPTTLIGLVSVLVAPHLWADWIVLLTTGTPDVGLWPFPVPVIYRLPVALALVVWGARTNRRWTVIAAAFIALPRLYFLSPALLVGIIPLLRGESWLAWLRRAPATPALPPTAAARTGTSTRVAEGA